MDFKCFCFEVKGETKEGSWSDKARPTWATLKAATSLAPSPAMPTTSPYCWNILTASTLCCGSILAIIRTCDHQASPSSSSFFCSTLNARPVSTSSTLPRAMLSRNHSLARLVLMASAARSWLIRALFPERDLPAALLLLALAVALSDVLPCSSSLSSSAVGSRLGPAACERPSNVALVRRGSCKSLQST